MQTGRLSLPLGEAQAKLAWLISTGRELAAEVPRAMEAEVFRDRVDDWRHHTIQWLDDNIGGQAAYEFKVTISQVKTHVWNSSFWERYRVARRKEIESEVRVLESIAQHLPDWVQPTSSNSGKPRRPPARATRRTKNGPRQGLGIAVDTKAVMVIYGHDLEAKSALFQWLRTIGLEPKEWEQLVKESKSASPYTGQVLQHAFDNVQAVVALFTPDEHVQAATAPPGAGHEWRLQARPNVLVETGMALITHPDSFVIICLGLQESDLPSDLQGRHYVRLDRSPKSLNAIANLLESAGCPVNREGDWLEPEIFPERDDISARPQQS